MAQKFTTGIALRDLASETADAVGVDVSGDTYDRIKVEAGGKIVWGDGTAAGDTNLYRDAADRLKTDDVFQSAGGLVTLTTDGTPTDALPDGALAVDVTNDLLYARSGGAWVLAGGQAEGTPASGADGYVQFATSGSLDGASAFAWDDTNNVLNVDGLLNTNNPLRAGQIGDEGIDHTSWLNNNGLLEFNEFWADRGDVSYSTTTDRFTVAQAGVYRITINFVHYKTSATPTDLRVGINTDTPGTGDPASTDTPHRGRCYVSDGPSRYFPGMIESIVELEANDYIVFFLKTGKIYNASDNRYTQFSIQRIA